MSQPNLLLLQVESQAWR